MNKSTVLVLALVALLLGGAVYLQTEREKDYDPSLGEPLLGEGRIERVTEIRVDHIERGKNYHMSRLEDGWQLIDPINYPANEAMVKVFLEALAGAGEYVPAGDLPALEAHFERPRAVVFVTETMEGGAKVEHEIQVGELDVDGQRLEVRTRGKILRIWRNLDTAIMRSIADLRRKKLFRMRGQDVVTIQRLGAEYRPDGAIDLTTEAERRGPRWVLSRPVDMQLDPGVTGLWAIALTSIRAERYISDIDDPNLASYGLKDPAIRLRLGDRRGRDEEVHIGVAPGGGWCARVAGDKHIIELDLADLPQILQPIQELWDTNLLQAFRRDIAAVELARVDRADLRFVQDDSENWTVAQRPPGQRGFDLPVAADVAAVEGLLAVLEQNEIEQWLDGPGETPAELFPAGTKPRGVWVELRGLLEGERQGGQLGERRVTEAGTELDVFLREGDELAGLVTSELATWLERDLADWRSRQLWALKEIRLNRLRLAQGEKSREFGRQIQGTWRYVDVDAPATELFDVLDSLIFLKAESHLTASQAAEMPLQDPFTVEFTTVDGDASIARIGLAERNGASEVQVEVLGLRSVAKDQGLYERLGKILP